MKVKKVLISQPEPPDLSKSAYSEIASKYKVKVDFNKFIQVEGLNSREFRDQRVSIADYQSVLMTSKNAIDHFFRLAKETRVTIDQKLKYFCSNEATAYYLQKYVQYRKRKIFYGKQGYKDLIDIIAKHSETTLLLPVAEDYKSDIPNMLSAKEIKYNKAIFYRVISSDIKEIDIKEYDLILLFSPLGVNSLFDNFPDIKDYNLKYGAFGAATAKEVEAQGLNLEISAPSPGITSMTMALDQYLAKSNK